MLYGIDFSFGNGLTTEQLKGAGKSFVARYLSGGSSKDVSATELANYKAAGIAVIFVFETGGIMPSQAQGAADAQTAQAELDSLARAVGDPSISQAPVFFAADASSEPDLIGYLQGSGSIVGKARNGLYADYFFMKAAFDAGLISYGWQTYAWSSGAWDNRALLRQVLNGQVLGPAQVDLDIAAFWNSTDILTLADDFGQWPRPGSPPPPPSQGPYRHEVLAGNSMTLDGIARNRNTWVSSILSLTQQNADPGNVAIINAYVVLDNALATKGKPRPAMPEGLVYYTLNP